MPTIGVNIAILDNGKLLLTQREDFEVWCLPGGAVDAGESLAEAALREAREETGLTVELTHLVGLYSRPNWHEDGTHIAVFAARPVTGNLRPQRGEVIALRFFGLEEIPSALLFGQRQRILDVFAGVCGVVWSQREAWPMEKDLAREELYARRDRSGLSRQEYYMQTFGKMDGSSDRLDVTCKCGDDE